MSIKSIYQPLQIFQDQRKSSLKTSEDCGISSGVLRERWRGPEGPQDSGHVGFVGSSGFTSLLLHHGPGEPGKPDKPRYLEVGIDYKI